MYYRSFGVVTLKRQFLKELCSLKLNVHFSHLSPMDALILKLKFWHMHFVSNCSTDQVRVPASFPSMTVTMCTIYTCNDTSPKCLWVCNVLSEIAYFLHHFIVLVRAYCVIELFVGLIHWYGLKWSDDRDELNVFKSASFFLPSDIQNRKIWCPSRTSNSVAHMMSSIWSQEAVPSIQIWVCSLYT